MRLEERERGESICSGKQERCLQIPRRGGRRGFIYIKKPPSVAKENDGAGGNEIRIVREHPCPGRVATGSLASLWARLNARLCLVIDGFRPPAARTHHEDRDDQSLQGRGAHGRGDGRTDGDISAQEPESWPARLHGSRSMAIAAATTGLSTITARRGRIVGVRTAEAEPGTRLAATKAVGGARDGADAAEKRTARRLSHVSGRAQR
jgi:hypothetical protein